MHLSIHPSIYLSIYLCIFLSIYLTGIAALYRSMGGFVCKVSTEFHAPPVLVLRLLPAWQSLWLYRRHAANLIFVFQLSTKAARKCLGLEPPRMWDSYVERRVPLAVLQSNGHGLDPLPVPELEVIVIISALGVFFPHQTLEHIHFLLATSANPPCPRTTPTFLSNRTFPGQTCHMPGNVFAWPTATGR